MLTKKQHHLALVTNLFPATLHIGCKSTSNQGLLLDIVIKNPITCSPLPVGMITWRHVAMSNVFMLTPQSCISGSDLRSQTILIISGDVVSSGFSQEMRKLDLTKD
jgi:hypothetical protein